MIRIGIIGCGRILAAHLQGYRLLREAGVDDFRITALCARKESDARMFIRQDPDHPQRPPVSNIPGDPLAVGPEYLEDFQPDTEVQVFTDYRRMIAEGPVDAINDLTLHSLHHPIAEAAFAAGKDLLSQKPLAVTIRAAQRMVAQAESADRVFGVFENFRNRPGTRHLRWLLDTGRIGRLQMASVGIVAAWWAPDQIVAGTPWRHQYLEAGGLALDMGVHLFHGLRHLAGPLRSVQGRTAILEPERVERDPNGNVLRRISCDADDTFFADFETQEGATGNIVSSWAGHGGPTLFGEGQVFYTTQGRVTGDTFLADDGTSRSVAEWYRKEAEATRREGEFPHGLEDSFALNQGDWLAAVRERRDPETSGREGLQDLACAYAVLESARSGRRVEIGEVLNGELRDYQIPLDRHFGLEP